MEAPVAVADTDNQEDRWTQEVDNLGRAEIAAGTDDTLHKQEEEEEEEGDEAEEHDCNRKQAVYRDYILAVDTYYSCTATEAVVVVVVVVPDKPLCHNDRVVEDTEDILEVDAVDRDCNCSNYCNHNQTVVECCQVFLQDLTVRLNSNGWQSCLATFLGHHLKGNPATNLHSPLQIDHRVFLRPDRCPGYLKCPIEKMCKKLKITNKWAVYFESGLILHFTFFTSSSFFFFFFHFYIYIHKTKKTSVPFLQAQNSKK